MSKSRRKSDSIGSLEDAHVRASLTSLDAATVQSILKKLEENRKAYQDSLNRTHELLAQVLSSQVSGSLAGSTKAPSIASAPSPRIKPTNPPLSPPLTQQNTDRRNTNTTLDTFTTLHDGSKEKTSTLSADDESDTDEDEALYVQDLLEPEEFSEEGLKSHVTGHKWTEAGRSILQDVLEDRRLLQREFLLPTTPHPTPMNDRSHLTHYSIFDVGIDGAPLHLEFADDRPALSRSRDIWRRISRINADSTRSKQAVGRITIVREPSPLLFAALHYTLKDHFDMDEIFAFLIADKTKAIPHRPWDNDVKRRKTFVFTFEYFTIIGDECRPMRWQRADQGRDGTETHIPITRCASVVALSFEGKPLKRIKHRGRRSDIFRKEGEIFDPFSPWHVLSITAHPDWRSTVDSHDSTKHYVNGPEAFLVTLRAEFKDAQKRLMDVYNRISDLVTTPADFMFKREIRDKLLFEDDQYTYSRRYFWAYQSLAIMNEDIKEMRIAYQDTFDDKFWGGTNKVIWPSDSSQRHKHWRKRMANFRNDIEKEIRGLEEIDRLNDEKMKEIKALRENLFSGTSVMESREAVRQQAITVIQGHNIKVLTLVTIFFLPLTFVTSVFGMTNMPPNDNFVRFGVVTLVICLPTYMLIGSLGSESGFQFWKKTIGRLFSSRFYKKYLRQLFGLFGYKPKWLEPRPVTQTVDAPTRPSNHPRTLSATEGIAARGGFGPDGPGETPPISHGVTLDRFTSITFEPKSPTAVPDPSSGTRPKPPEGLLRKSRAREQVSESRSKDDKESWASRLFTWKQKGAGRIEDGDFP